MVRGRVIVLAPSVRGRGVGTTLRGRRLDPALFSNGIRHG